MSGTTSYDITQLIGFNYNGLESDNVDVANADSGNGDPASLNYVLGTQTYNLSSNDYGGNGSDVGSGPNNVDYQITNAANGTNVDGTPLANTLAIGQVIIEDTDNGFAEQPFTYDVLGYSQDGSTILIGATAAYAGLTAGDPYNGQYLILSDANTDYQSINSTGTGAASPPPLLTFTPTNTYTGGPFFETATPAFPGNPGTATPAGVNGDVVSITNALVGKTLPTFNIVTTSSGSGTTVNADGSYVVNYTQSALAVKNLTFAVQPNAFGPQGQPILKLGTLFFAVVGFNQTQILLEGSSTTGVLTNRYSVLSITNVPPQNSPTALDLTFQNFGPHPNAGQAYPCFMAGTRIATTNGEVAVEDLKAGDLVLTVEGDARPVRWLGRSKVAKMFIDPVRTAPVRILAGALGENLPTRDLLVSPDHAMFIGGCLVQAGALINGTTIVRETNVDDVFTYYHLELDAHCLVLAEGAATETFVDNIDRMSFDNWNEHPETNGVEMAEMPYARAKSARQVPGAVRAIIGERVIAVLGKNAVAA